MSWADEWKYGNGVGTRPCDGCSKRRRCVETLFGAALCKECFE